MEASGLNLSFLFEYIRIHCLNVRERNCEHANLEYQLGLSSCVRISWWWSSKRGVVYETRAALKFIYKSMRIFIININYSKEITRWGTSPLDRPTANTKHPATALTSSMNSPAVSHRRGRSRNEIKSETSTLRITRPSGLSIVVFSQVR